MNAAVPIPGTEARVLVKHRMSVSSSSDGNTIDDRIRFVHQLARLILGEVESVLSSSAERAHGQSEGCVQEGIDSIHIRVPLVDRAGDLVGGRVVDRVEHAGCCLSFDLAGCCQGRGGREGDGEDGRGGGIHLVPSGAGG